MNPERRVIDGIEYLLIPVGEVEQKGRREEFGRFMSLAGIKPKPVRWLWADRIPLSVATLAAGIPGQGKSHICLDLGAKVSKGLLPGDYQGKPSGVVVEIVGDMIEETIVPRLIAAQADMRRVFTLPFTTGAFDVDKDMPELQALVEHKSIRLVILDPLLAFTMTDGFKEAEVRRMLEPAQRLMVESKVSIRRRHAPEQGRDAGRPVAGDALAGVHRAGPLGPVRRR